MTKIELTELERRKMAEAGRQSIPCQHGWRPIETAPKDGTEILVSLEHRYIKIAFFSDVCGEWSDGYDGIDTPTHWQPLPKPPQETV